MTHDLVSAVATEIIVCDSFRTISVRCGSVVGNLSQSPHAQMYFLAQLSMQFQPANQLAVEVLVRSLPVSDITRPANEDSV